MAEVGKLTLPNYLVYSPLISHQSNKTMKVRAAFYVQFEKVDNSFRELQTGVWKNASSPSTLATVLALSSA